MFLIKDAENTVYAACEQIRSFHENSSKKALLPKIKKTPQLKVLGRVIRKDGFDIVGIMKKRDIEGDSK